MYKRDTTKLLKQAFTGIQGSCEVALEVASNA